MPKKPVFVSPKPSGGWKVQQAGQRISDHDTQAKAIESGRREARRDQTELNVQGRNGQIRIKNSYGRDNFPPRG